MRWITCLLSSFLVASAVAQGGPEVRWMVGGHAQPLGIRSSNDGSRILTFGNEGTVKIRRSTDGALVSTVFAHGLSFGGLDFARSANRFATLGGGGSATGTGSLIVWDGATLQPIRAIPVKADARPILSPDGNWVAALRRGVEVEVYRVDTGARVHAGSALGFAFSDDSQSFWSNVREWDGWQFRGIFSLRRCQDGALLAIFEGDRAAGGF